MRRSSQFLVYAGSVSVSEIKKENTTGKGENNDLVEFILNKNVMKLNGIESTVAFIGLNRTQPYLKPAELVQNLVHL